MSISAHKTSAAQPIDLLVATAFSLLLTFYWLLLYAASPTEDVSRGSVLYWLHVGPVLLFVGIFTLPALHRAVTPATALLLLFATLVIAVAVMRSDYSTATSIALLTGVLVIISAFRISAPAKLLNILFVSSIILGALTYGAGINGYGVVPGYGYDEFLVWRVSLFPTVPESAYFSALILSLNLVIKNLPLRRTCLLLSVYFLMFSGLRSTLVAVALVSCYWFAVRMSWLSAPNARLAAIGLAALVFVASLLMSHVLALLPGLDAQFLNVYLFRLEEGIQSSEDVTRTVYRTWLWSEHFRIAEQNPVFGIGTFDFSELADPDPGMPLGSGSESFLTGLYARVGLAVLLFIAFVAVAVRAGAKERHHLPLIAGLLAFVAMLAYGSFIVPYNFIFLVMMALVVGKSPEVLTSSNRHFMRSGRKQGPPQSIGGWRAG